MPDQVACRIRKQTFDFVSVKTQEEAFPKTADFSLRTSEAKHAATEKQGQNSNGPSLSP